MKRGLLVAIEGIDGSGKSTLASALARVLRKNWRTVVLTKEPTKTKAGMFARKLVKVSTDDHIQAVFADDRALHVKNVISPALKKGKVVICDRYILSSICCAHDANFARTLNSSFPIPNLTIVLDVPASVALKRLQKKGIASMFESRNELERVRRNYLRSKGVLRLDGTSPIKTLIETVAKKIKKFNFDR